MKKKRSKLRTLLQRFRPLQEWQSQIQPPLHATPQSPPTEALEVGRRHLLKLEEPIDEGTGIEQLKSLWKALNKSRAVVEEERLKFQRLRSSTRAVKRRMMEQNQLQIVREEETEEHTKPKRTPDRPFELDSQTIEPESRACAPRNGDPRSGELRNGDPRSGELRSGDPRSGETRGFDVRASETRAGGFRAGELRGIERRNSDPRTSDARIWEVRTSEGRGSDCRGFESRVLEPRRPWEQDNSAEQSTGTLPSPLTRSGWAIPYSPATSTGIIHRRSAPAGSSPLSQPHSVSPSGRWMGLEDDHTRFYRRLLKLHRHNRHDRFPDDTPIETPMEGVKSGDPSSTASRLTRASTAGLRSGISPSGISPHGVSPFTSGPFTSNFASGPFTSGPFTSGPIEKLDMFGIRSRTVTEPIEPRPASPRSPKLDAFLKSPKYPRDQKPPALLPSQSPECDSLILTAEPPTPGGFNVSTDHRSGGSADQADHVSIDPVSVDRGLASVDRGLASVDRVSADNKAADYISADSVSVDKASADPPGQCPSHLPVSGNHSSMSPRLSAGEMGVDCKRPGRLGTLSDKVELKLELPPRGGYGVDFGKIGYSHYDFLAEGSLGVLHLVRGLETGDNRLWVAKVVDLENFGSQDEATQALLEAELLRRLKHPNIVEYVASHVTDTALIIIMEYCEGGDLHSHLKAIRDQGKYVPEVQVIRWLRDIARALHHMHKQNILHCDVKSSNVFLAPDGEKRYVAKIGDLGVARELKLGSEALSPSRCPRGTPVYMSPEMCKKAALTERSDCWSLGCILFEMCHLRHAFPSQLRVGGEPSGFLNYGRRREDDSVSIASSTFIPGVTGRSDMSYFSEELLKNLHRDLRRIKKRAPVSGLKHPASAFKAEDLTCHIAPPERHTDVELRKDTDRLQSKPFWSTKELLVPQILPGDYSPLLNYLVCAMLEPRPCDRPSLQEIVDILSQQLAD